MKHFSLKQVYHIDIENQTLKKSIFESKHLLRKPPAIAIDYGIFNKALEQGIKFIQIYGRETHTYFTATVEDFKHHSFTFDRGYGTQIALSLKYWNKSKSPELPTACREPSLFEEVFR